MWKTAIKLVTLFLIRKSVNQANSNIGKVKRNIADMTESRARFFRVDFNTEMNRIVHSFVGFMLALATIAGASLTAILWIAATAWSSPHRDIILGGTMLLLLIIGFTMFIFIYHSWKKEPLFNQSMLKIEQDWQMFRGLDGAADIAEAND